MTRFANLEFHGLWGTFLCSKISFVDLVVYGGVYWSLEKGWKTRFLVVHEARLFSILPASTSLWNYDGKYISDLCSARVKTLATTNLTFPSDFITVDIILVHLDKSWCRSLKSKKECYICVQRMRKPLGTPGEQPKKSFPAFFRNQ